MRGLSSCFKEAFLLKCHIVVMSPTIYLRKDLYDAILQRGEEVNGFVNRVVEQYLAGEKLGDSPLEERSKRVVKKGE